MAEQSLAIRVLCVTAALVALGIALSAWLVHEGKSPASVVELVEWASLAGLGLVVGLVSRRKAG